tara:strand:+ start:59 stop:1288 length:1230 start_codon:yes stop_codon:yes gene_type:complete
MANVAQSIPGSDVLLTALVTRPEFKNYGITSNEIKRLLATVRFLFGQTFAGVLFRPYGVTDANVTVENVRSFFIALAGPHKPSWEEYKAVVDKGKMLNVFLLNKWMNVSGLSQMMLSLAPPQVGATSSSSSSASSTVSVALAQSHLAEQKLVLLDILASEPGLLDGLQVHLLRHIQMLNGTHTMRSADPRPASHKEMLHVLTELTIYAVGKIFELNDSAHEEEDALKFGWSYVILMSAEVQQFLSQAERDVDLPSVKTLLDNKKSAYDGRWDTLWPALLAWKRQHQEILDRSSITAEDKPHQMTTLNYVHCIFMFVRMHNRPNAHEQTDATALRRVKALLTVFPNQRSKRKVPSPADGGRGKRPRQEPTAAPTAAQFGISEQELLRRRTQKACYRCGKKGHSHFKCYSK